MVIAKDSVKKKTSECTPKSTQHLFSRSRAPYLSLHSGRRLSGAYFMRHYRLSGSLEHLQTRLLGFATTRVIVSVAASPNTARPTNPSQRLHKHLHSWWVSEENTGTRRFDAAACASRLDTGNSFASSLATRESILDDPNLAGTPENSDKISDDFCLRSAVGDVVAFRCSADEELLVELSRCELMTVRKPRRACGMSNGWFSNWGGGRGNVVASSRTQVRENVGQPCSA